MHGIFDYGTYWHVVSATLYQGGAVLMGLAIIVRVLSPPHWYIRGIDMRLANGTMVALLSVWSLAFAILAMLTGIFMTWGVEATTFSSLTLNKSMFNTFALLSLVLMLWVRFRYGSDLWDDRALRVSYSLLGFVAVGVAIINGSLGGEAGLLGSILSPAWNYLGMAPQQPLVLPAVVGMFLLAVLLLVLVGVPIGRLVLRRRGLGDISR